MSFFRMFIKCTLFSEIHIKNFSNFVLTYYQKAEAMEPDNLNIAMQTGQSLLSLGQYEEALRYFHKVEYLSKKPDNARRAIAWTSFKDKKFEDALKFYHLLM